MNRKTWIMLAIILVVAICFGGCNADGCRESDRVSYNISREADQFKVVRRLTVINCIKGDVLFVMEGKMSIEVAAEQLSIIVQDGSAYKKHIVGLSDNVTYTLEDLSTNFVDEYHYTIYFNPEMWLPISFSD